MTFRNEYPAFGGKLAIRAPSEQELEMTWQRDRAAAILRADVAARSYTIQYRDAESGRWMAL
jgi:sucrose phosphorylase